MRVQWQDDFDESPVIGDHGLELAKLEMQDDVASDTSEMASMVGIFTAPSGGITIKLDTTAAGNNLFWHDNCHVLITEFK